MIVIAIFAIVIAMSRQLLRTLMFHSPLRCMPLRHATLTRRFDCLIRHAPVISALFTLITQHVCRAIMLRLRRLLMSHAATLRCRYAALLCRQLKRGSRRAPHAAFVSALSALIRQRCRRHTSFRRRCRRQPPLVILMPMPLPPRFYSERAICRMPVYARLDAIIVMERNRGARAMPTRCIAMLRDARSVDAADAAIIAHVLR